MADKFYAATRIKHGTRHEDDSQEGKYESKVFEVDDLVEGLSVEDMKSLWNAGALRRETAEDRERQAAKKDDSSEEDKGGDKESPKPPAAKSTPAKATTPPVK